MLKAEVIHLTIHENLRRLRQMAGMTQEQVAEKIGITRQALSSYESGRTRPDIDMLMRLSEIYGTDIDGILYGQEKRLKTISRINTAAKILLILLAFLSVISAGLLWSANYFFAIAEGNLSAEELALFSARQKIIGAWEIVDAVILLIAILWGIALLVFINREPGIVSLKTKLKYLAAISGVVLLPGMLFGLADASFSVMNYLVTPMNAAAIFVILFTADLAISYVRKKKQKE